MIFFFILLDVVDSWSDLLLDDMEMSLKELSSSADPPSIETIGLGATISLRGSWPGRS